MDTQQLQQSQSESESLPPGQWTNRPLTLADLDAVVERLGGAIAQGISKSQRRKVTIGEYDPRSSYHPKKSEWKHFRADTTFFQNGVQLEENNVKDAEVLLWNRIERPGRYIDRRVIVTVRDEGGQREVQVRYPNSKVDHRLDNARYWNSAEQLLQKIVDEQDATIAKENERENLLKRFLERERKEQADEQAKEEARDVKAARRRVAAEALEGEVVDSPNEDSTQKAEPVAASPRRKAFGKSKKFQAALDAADAKARAKSARKGKK